MSGRLTARVLAAGGLLVTVATLSFAVLLAGIGDQRRSVEQAQHAEAALAATGALERVALELEAAARGSARSGKPTFLEQWRRARLVLPARTRELLLRASDGEQRERAEEIGRELRAYVLVHAAPLVAAASADPARARALLAAGAGDAALRAVHARLERFSEAELRLAAAAGRRAAASAHRALYAGTAGLGGSILLLLLLAGYFGRRVVSPLRRFAAAAAAIASGDLTARAPREGTDEVGELGRALNAMAAALEERSAELERERARLATIFGQIPAGVCIAEAPSGKLVLGNEHFEAILGHGLILADSVADYRRYGAFHPGCRAYEPEEYPLARSLLQGEIVRGQQIDYRRPDGSTVVIEVNAAPIRDAAGGLSGAAAVFMDVTERRQAEDEIRALNEVLRSHGAALERQTAALEAALDQLAAAKERVEAFYRFGERLAAESKLEPLAETILAGIAEVVGSEAGALYVLDGDYPAGGGSLRLCAALSVDRKRLPVELRGSGDPAAPELAALIGVSGLSVPLRHGGRLLGLLALAERSQERPFSDTESGMIRHLADQAAVALATALAVAEAGRLARINETVLDATVDGIGLADLEGNLLVLNPAVHRIAAVHGIELPLRLTEELWAALAELTTDPAGYRAETAANRASPDRKAVYEYELAGTGRWFRRYTAPVRNEAGAVTARIFVFRETTAERETDKLKSELVATVSHELRTPLSSILGYAELLAGRKLNPKTRARYAETIHSEANRLSHLIDDFLDLQRIEQGSFALAPEPFPLQPLLAETVELFAAQSNAHTLTLAMPRKPLVVLGERDRVAQVVGNLLSNAIKYSPAGGDVELTAATRNGAVRVSVKDCGLGIPADQQHELFTKFFRVNTAERQAIGGTGLGLALCREIVEAHGGESGVASIEGEGATFWFELPAAPRAGAGTKGPGTKRRPPRSSTRKPASAVTS